MNWFALEEKDSTDLKRLARAGGAIARINPIVSCYEGGYTAATGRDAQNPSVEVDTADRIQAGAQATAEVGGGVAKVAKAAAGLFGIVKCTKAAPIADKFSRVPKSLMDEMVLEAAKKGKGQRIIANLNDPEFKGMEKWSYSELSATGLRSEVHYVRDPNTGNLMDFKFKIHAETYK